MEPQIALVSLVTTQRSPEGSFVRTRLQLSATELWDFTNFGLFHALMAPFLCWFLLGIIV